MSKDERSTSLKQGYTIRNICIALHCVCPTLTAHQELYQATSYSEHVLYVFVLVSKLGYYQQRQARS